MTDVTTSQAIIYAETEQEMDLISQVFIYAETEFSILSSSQSLIYVEIEESSIQFGPRIQVV